MDDLISKKAAIDALDTGLWGVEWDKALAIARLEDLPSAQPEIVRCKDCKYHHKRICPIERYFSLDGFCSRGKRREVTT